MHPISVLQTEYSLWTRDVEREILPAVRALDIGFVAYSPLGRGFLSGRFSTPEDISEDDFRANNPRFQGENFWRNMRIVEQLRELADEEGATAAQLALAWVHHREVVPIPGTKRRRYLEENVAATEVDLSDDDLERLDRAAPPGQTAGDRYPDMSPVES